MATYEFRPLAFGEILDGSIGIYRRIFGTLISIAIVCQGIPSLLNIYVELAGGVVFNLGLWAVSFILGIIGYLLAAGATLRAISERYLGREPTLGSALAYAVKKAWRLFVAGLGKYLLIGLASIFLFIPGIIVACGYSVVAQVAVLEELRAPTDALSRSWFLTKGYKWRAFGFYVLIYLLMYIPFFAAGMIAAMNPDLFARPGALLALMVASQLIWLLIYPLFTCVFTLFYYDLRVRKEAFDLEHLGRQLELGSAGV
ncbi:MAG: hypothetical protein PVJ64_01275 [Gemmatimonadales bacterium]|jgi:uncharacterized membrane protein